MITWFVGKMVFSNRCIGGLIKKSWMVSSTWIHPCLCICDVFPFNLTLQKYYVYPFSATSLDFVFVFPFSYSCYLVRFSSMKIFDEDNCIYNLSLKFVPSLRDEIKVTKSQKQFFLKVHCPKNERNILPYWV